MNFIPGLISALFLLGAITSCGGSSSTRVDLAKSLSFLSSSHHVLFMGRYYPTGTRISLIADNDGFDIDLTLGNWRFGIIAWERNPNGPFSGAPICSVVDKTVTRSTTSIEFDVQTVNCKDPFFRGRADFDDPSGQFQVLKLKSCMNLSGVTAYDSSCPIVSEFTHYQAILKANHRGLVTSLSENSLTSNCKPFNTGSDLRLPVLGDNWMDLEIATFSDGACENKVRSFSFPKGLIEYAAVTRIFDEPFANQSVVFLSNNLPNIIAVNTIQLSLGGTIQIGSTRSRTISFIKPNHYSGPDAISCAILTRYPAEVATDSCTCSGGVCTLNFMVDNTVGSSEIDWVEFQYTLTDSDGNTSNVASARSCSGQNGSCTL